MVFLRHELQSKGVVVRLDLGPALPQVRGDRTLVQQVIVNPAINSAQAMAQPGTTRRILAARTTLGDAHAVNCTLEDSGPASGRMTWTGSSTAFSRPRRVAWAWACLFR